MNNCVLIEVEIEPTNVVDTTDYEIRASKAKVIRIVPISEWNEWISDL